MNPIDPKTSLRFMQQSLTDLAQTLPLSAREPFLGAANFHLSNLEQALTPAAVITADESGAPGP